MFGPLVGKPGSSKRNKTGSWRIESRPVFLQKNCAGCRMCLSICPEGCIEQGDKNKFVCNYDYCKGCGMCALICPKADVVMVKEEEAAKQAEKEEK
jgi:pyruvate ferredoxin oxidoreductase delta subunit